MNLWSTKTLDVFVLWPNSVFFLKLLRDWGCCFFISLCQEPYDFAFLFLCFCSTPPHVSLTLSNDLLPYKISVTVLQSSYCASVNTVRSWHLFLLKAFSPFGFQATTLFWLSSPVPSLRVPIPPSFPQLLLAPWVLSLVFPQFWCALLLFCFSFACSVSSANKSV